jgi:hypothetical protein
MQKPKMYSPRPRGQKEMGNQGVRPRVVRMEIK